MRSEYDAVVVGSGPNGLAAGVELARTGHRVLLVEAAAEIGGGTRTAELTLPGFRHDVCSAIHPLGAASPFFTALPLGDFGLEWIHPPLAFSHPLDGGRAAGFDRSLEATAQELGPDAGQYRRMMGPLVRRGRAVLDAVLGPALRMSRHPMALATFGRHAPRSATGLAGRFTTEEARALLAGLAAHSAAPLDRAFTAAVALVLGLAGHVAGWPLARGGSAAIAAALAGYYEELGGEIQTGHRVTALADLPAARAYLLDVDPIQAATIGADRFPDRFQARLEQRGFGPAVFKVDWALAEPIPWSDPISAGAGTVHVGGTLEEIAAAEAAVNEGEHPDQPFVLVAQQSRFDPTRAPDGRHTAWGYCHVPLGSDADMTAAVEAQVERFAPGFGRRILARHTMGPAAMEDYNRNYVGGNVTGGEYSLGQILAGAGIDPHATPDPAVFLCSAYTSPGPGVHGMCGYWAARAALRGPLRP